MLLKSQVVKGSYRYGDALKDKHGDELAKHFLTKKGKMTYCVIVEMGKATTGEDRKHHVRTEMIFPESYLAIDDEHIMLPDSVPNPIQGGTPQFVDDRFFEMRGKMTADHLELRFAQYPYPLSTGFREVALDSSTNILLYITFQ
jgi:hypothetical protein